MNLEELLLEGNKRGIAKAITLAERDEEAAIKLIRDLYDHTGNAYVIGITGPPGVGKSTLTHKLAKQLSEEGNKIGIIAVDPSSPFTGGALLGDRIRMQDLSLDPNVFIRSMGTRGQLGGLAKSTQMAVRMLDISGMDYIFIETVGVGQSEVDIVKTADTTTMVMAPGMGDDIQAIKAGIMEIGEIFVVNKADKDKAQRKIQELRMALELNDDVDWKPPVLKTIAKDSEGITDLINKISEHKRFLEEEDKLITRRRKQIKEEIIQICKGRMTEKIIDNLNNKEIKQELNEIVNKEKDPYIVAQKLLKRV